MKTTDLGGEWFANQHDDGTLTLRNSEKGQRIDLPAVAVQALAGALINGALLQIAKDHEKAALYYARKAEAVGESSAGFRLTAKMARDLIDSVETPKQLAPKPPRPNTARRAHESDADYIDRLLKLVLDHH